jgi:hypothetical protein
LILNGSKSFQGTNVVGIGFAVEDQDAEMLKAQDAKCSLVLKRFVSGADLNDQPRPSGTRQVIDFGEMTEQQARSYASCMSIVEASVRPVRAASNRARYREKWWQFGEPCRDLYATIANLDRVLAMALTSKVVLPVFTSTDQVFQHTVGVFAYSDDAHFGVLTSSFHWWWSIAYSSTLETRIRYNPKDLFETFPQPTPESGPAWNRIEDAGRALDQLRAPMMTRANLGLTKTYNRVHNPDEQDADIVRLRELHVELDRAVRDAYGWSDLDLDHHHWETSQGVRFTVSPAAKDGLLDRLLELNHRRYAEEVAAGLHERKSKKAPVKRAKALDMNQESML